MRAAARRTLASGALLAVLLVALAPGGCGGPEERAEPAPRSRDRRGATPQETVTLVREALERRRYRDVLLHVLPEDRALFTLGRWQALEAFAAGLEGEETPRRLGIEKGLAALGAQQTVAPEALRLGHESALAHADLGSILDRLGTLGAAHAVDALGGFADLVPEFHDWHVEGDEAHALSGEGPAAERWTFRRHEGAWYYVARE